MTMIILNLNFGGNGDSGECGASRESGSSVDSDKSFNLFNRQKSKFKICGR